MIVQALRSEFLHEVENTRKLLNAIPDATLDYKPSAKSWTTAQLASHIAGIYDWYESTLQGSGFDVATYQYDRGDLTKAASIVAKFEENAAKAKAALEAASDESMNDLWTMKAGNRIIIPASPRSQVVRGFLMNHLYHHRGEMIVYLRATGNKVPGPYGPTADEN